MSALAGSPSVLARGLPGVVSLPGFGKSGGEALGFRAVRGSKWWRRARLGHARPALTTLSGGERQRIQLAIEVDRSTDVLALTHGSS
jgi:hypothetical protein